MIGDDNSAVERVKTLGVRASSPIDLIAIGFSRTEFDAVSGETMARRILTRYGNIRSLGEANKADIASMTGLDEFEILRAQSLIEIGRKAGLAAVGAKIAIQSPEDATKLVVQELQKFKHEKREHVFVIVLDTKNQILKFETLHIGTLNMSLIGPREVFHVALREMGSSIILAHNHPSGDPTPSIEDIEITEKLVRLGKELDIPVLDHLIIGDPNWVSLHDRGVL